MPVTVIRSSKGNHVVSCEPILFLIRLTFTWGVVLCETLVSRERLLLSFFLTFFVTRCMNGFCNSHWKWSDFVGFIALVSCCCCSCSRLCYVAMLMSFWLYMCMHPFAFKLRLCSCHVVAAARSSSRQICLATVFFLNTLGEHYAVWLMCLMTKPIMANNQE